jgi:LacI family transcriptional regulator
MADVAAHAGVSLGTVSNVLNHPHKVSESTILKVRAAIDALGFVRDSNASSLAAGGSSKNIGLVVIDISNTLFVDVARGAQAAASAVDMHLMLANSDNDPALQDANVEFFDSARVAGILLAPASDCTDSIRTVRAHNRPVVLLNYDPQPRDCCSVLVDNEHVGYLAARHLIDEGRTRLAFVGGRDDLQPVHLRRTGVRRAVAETGGRVTLEEIATPDLNPPSGIEAGERLAARALQDRPDGVIGVTDLLGMAVIEVFTRHGIVVPDAAAVMGCDFNSAAWGGAIPLTSVRMRGFDMGLESVRLLIDEITTPAEEHGHRTIMLEPVLEIRESTVGRDRLRPQP